MCLWLLSFRAGCGIGQVGSCLGQLSVGRRQCGHGPTAWCPCVGQWKTHTCSLRCALRPQSKLPSLSKPFLWQQWQSRKLYSSSLFSWPSPWPEAASPRQVLLSGPWVAIFSISSGSRGHNYQADSISSLQMSIKTQQCIGWLSWEWSALFAFTKGGLAYFPGLFPLEKYCYTYLPQP